MTSSSSHPLGALVFTIAAAALLAPSTGEAQTTNAPVTFTKDVAPIFQEKCEACHRPDSIAPMSLRTYEEARPWARSIRARVESRQMPPWHIDKTVGIQHFKNDRSLTEAQLATVLAWVDQGAVKGDPKDLPAPRQWPEGQGWNYAAMFGQTEPDLIIRNQPWTQKAGQGRTRPDKATPGSSGWSTPASPNRAGCGRSKCARARSRAARSRITPTSRSTRSTPTARCRPGDSWSGPLARRARSCARTPAS
jgi:hypothetical protein